MAHDEKPQNLIYIGLYISLYHVLSSNTAFLAPRLNSIILTCIVFFPHHISWIENFNLRTYNWKYIFPCLALLYLVRNKPREVGRFFWVLLMKNALIPRNQRLRKNICGRIKFSLLLEHFLPFDKAFRCVEMQNPVNFVV